MAIAAAAGRGRRTPRVPRGLLLTGLAIGIACGLPVVYLVVVIGDSTQTALDAIALDRTLPLIARSLGLAVAVTLSAVAIAVPLAWLTSRTDLPGRRAWTVLTTLPLVVPSYIGAYIVVSALGPRGLLQQALEPLGVERLPSVYGFVGAWLTLTVFTYPLVALTVRAALRRLDPQLEEAARGMGRSGWRTFRDVVLPQLVPAMGAGGLLVILYVLADFGAVAILRVDTFTAEIYVAYRSSFDRAGAAALAAVLVLLMLAILWVESRIRRGRVYHRSTPGVARAAPPVELGRWRGPALAFCGLLTLVGLVLPVSVLVYWSFQSVAGDLDIGEVVAASGRSLLAAGLAAGVAALVAIPIALLSARYPSPLSALVERLSYSGYALPGIVIALSLVFVGTRLILPLYQSLAMLVFAYVVLKLPLAVGATQASLLQVSPRVEEAARSVGRGPLAVFATITAPLAVSGVLAGASLVFLKAISELPATLILKPIGFDTLSTEIWDATTVGFYEGAAFPALALLAICAVPLYLLTARSDEAAPAAHDEG